jgi:hypothetical protein
VISRKFRFKGDILHILQGDMVLAMRFWRMTGQDQHIWEAIERGSILVRHSAVDVPAELPVAEAPEAMAAIPV